MTTPDELERQHTLMTAAARYDQLRMQDTLGTLAAGDALEMLALGELLARKAGYGRQIGVRSARAAGATWTQIGAALGTTKQSAWEAHIRWIDEQATKHRRTGLVGMDADDEAVARSVAGPDAD
jgi:hypothetical protein